MAARIKISANQLAHLGLQEKRVKQKRTREKRTKATNSQSERDIQKAIMQYLQLKGCKVIRINSGGMKNANNQFVKFNNSPGCSDLLTCLPDGQFAAIEVKRPGEEASPKQKHFLLEVRMAGGIGIVATSVDDVIQQVPKLA